MRDFSFISSCKSLTAFYYRSECFYFSFLLRCFFLFCWVFSFLFFSSTFFRIRLLLFTLSLQERFKKLRSPQHMIECIVITLFIESLLSRIKNDTREWQLQGLGVNSMKLSQEKNLKIPMMNTFQVLGIAPILMLIVFRFLFIWKHIISLGEIWGSKNQRFKIGGVDSMIHKGHEVWLFQGTSFILLSMILLILKSRNFLISVMAKISLSFLCFVIVIFLRMSRLRHLSESGQSLLILRKIPLNLLSKKVRTQWGESGLRSIFLTKGKKRTQNRSWEKFFNIPFGVQQKKSNVWCM